MFAIDPDNPPSLTEEPLAPIELEMRAHWERFRPDLCRQLKAESPDALDRAIRRAWWDHEYSVGLLLARNPTMHRLQAEQECREMLWPRPERRMTQAPRRAITR